MGTLSRPFCLAASAIWGYDGRASANGASGAVSVEVMPWPYPLFASLLLARAGKQGDGGGVDKRDDRGDRKSELPRTVSRSRVPSGGRASRRQASATVEPLLIVCPWFVRGIGPRRA